jgi:hypothetical protein
LGTTGVDLGTVDEEDADDGEEKNADRGNEVEPEAVRLLS